MKCWISCTSHKEPPCEGATLVEEIKEERFLWDCSNPRLVTQAWIDKYLVDIKPDGDRFIANVRRFSWFIEINSLEDLLALARVEGELILGHTDKPDEMSIEIYDSYRE